MKSNGNPSRFITHLWFWKLVGVWIFRILEIWTEKKKYRFLQLCEWKCRFCWCWEDTKDEIFFLKNRRRKRNEMGMSWFQNCQWGKELIKGRREGEIETQSELTDRRDVSGLIVNMNENGQWPRKDKREEQSSRKRDEGVCALLFSSLLILFLMGNGFYIKTRWNTV